MNKVLQRIICLVMIVAMFSVSFCACAKSSFSDIKQGSWYRPAVEYARDMRYMKGTGGNNFEPETKVTRAMLATILYRMSGSTKIYFSSSFKDNRIGQWYFNGIEYCYRNGIVVGYGNGKFGVDDPLLREDMMAMFYRYAIKMGYANATATSKNLLASYADYHKVSSYAKNSINWCLSSGVVDGVSYDKISPDTTATRAQLAQVLMNFDERVLQRNVSSYRVNSSNPYGIAAQNIRLHQKQFSFRLSGLPDKSALQLRVQYKVGGEVYKNETLQIDSALKFNYEGNADCLFTSADVNMGRRMDASAVITVLEQGRAVYAKSVYFGEFFQNASNGTPLYYKGQASMDCRILLYHEFTETVPTETKYSVVSTPKRFEENICYLLNHGYTIIPLEALIEFQNNTRALPQKSVVLTFDDGYTSNYSLIFPILKKYNIPATIFVTVSTMNNNYGKMTWDQMREMEQSGLVNIQSHSWLHVDHSALSQQQVHEYISSSFDLLEEKLGKRSPRLFAYPHGAYTEATIKIVKGYNVPLQVTTEWRALDMKRLDLLRLPRINVSYDADIVSLLRVSK